MARVPKRFDLASRHRLDAVADLAPRFFREVIGADSSEMLVTDESDLVDFMDTTRDRHTEVGKMLARMVAHYRVDGRLVRSTRIVDLLEFLAANGIGR